jgi:heme-degrading monooxygenase HmoA
MVMTILEARVTSDKWTALEQAYKAATQQLDPGITQTFLVHSSADLTLWRIITVWSSRQVLEAMRRSTETPQGVLMFRSAGAEPTLSVFDVVADATAPHV